MATIALAPTTRGLSNPARHEFMTQVTIDFATAASTKGTALAAGDIIQAISVPAGHQCITAGWEVLTAHTGTSTDTALDLGFTGGDPDIYVDAFDYDAAAIGAFASLAGTAAPVQIGATADTLDILIQAQTGTTTGGKLRVFAKLMDCSTLGEKDGSPGEVVRDELA